MSVDIKPPVVPSRMANKVPFTDEDASHHRRVRRREGRVEERQRIWRVDCEDLKDLILLKAYAGIPRAGC
jgi:hypothetical protein